MCREGIGTGRILQPQSHISISPCTFLSGLRRHKDAVAHPMGSTWTIPWWRDGFIHWHLPWRLFCDLKDNVEVGIQKWIHFPFSLKREMGTGLLDLGNSPKMCSSCTLPTCTPPRAVLPLPKDTTHIFMTRVSTAETGPESHSHTSCAEPASKTKPGPKSHLIPAASHPHPLSQHFQSPLGTYLEMEEEEEAGMLRAPQGSEPARARSIPSREGDGKAPGAASPPWESATFLGLDRPAASPACSSTSN